MEREKINDLMYMDDIRLFAKKRKRIGNPVRICSRNIGMEFGIEKRAMLVMKSGKRHTTEGVELPNQVVIRSFGEKETYKYLGKLEPTPSNKWKWKKKKFKKEYLRRTRKLLETKLHRRNLVKGINTWAVLFVRYSGSLLKWTREELTQMDPRTRKLMTMDKAWHPWDDVDRLYVSRREGGRRLTSIEDNLDASIQRLEDYIQKGRGRLITATRSNTDNTRISRTTITRKQKCEEKQFYGRFKLLTSDFSREKTGT